MAGPGWKHDALVQAWWVEPGRLLARGVPGEPGPGAGSGKGGRPGRRRGANRVDLTTPEDRLEPYAALVEQAASARDLVLDHVRFPIPDRGVVEDDRYDDVLDLIADDQRAGSSTSLSGVVSVGRARSSARPWPQPALITPRSSDGSGPCERHR